MQSALQFASGGFFLANRLSGTAFNKPSWKPNASIYKVSTAKGAAISNIDNLDHIIIMIAKSTLKDPPDVDTSFRVEGQDPCVSNIKDQEDKNIEFFVLTTGGDVSCAGAIKYVRHNDGKMSGPWEDGGDAGGDARGDASYAFIFFGSSASKVMQACSLCFICSFLIVNIIGLQTVGASDEDALMQLKQGFGNPNAFSSWNTSINASPCLGWVGVTCAANSSSVVQLSLPRRGFVGRNISSSIGDLSNLQFLYLQGNGLTGRIPPEINKLTSLQHLDLSNNALTGELPLLWSNLTKLVNLTLAKNKINGLIPTGLSSATSLVRIRLENNELYGSIPPAFFDNNLPKLRYFAVEYNNISGTIPAQIGRSVALKSFYAAHNNLTGLIPESIGGLPNLEHFEVNNNGLSGPLPESIINRTASLQTFNVSYNSLTGQIPASFSAKFNDSSAFMGNPSLCGSPLPNACPVQTISLSPPPPSALQPPSISRRDPSHHGREFPSYRKRSSRQSAKIIGGVIGGILGAFLLLFLFIVISRKLKQKKNSKSASVEGGNWFSPDIQANRRKGQYEVFSKSFPYSCYEEIVSNAGYFDTAHVVGKGRFATVYRSHLPDGTHIAVKVFRFANLGSNFEKELELLASIKHRNVLSIKGFYTNPVEKAIFYEFMPTGSLYDLLHGQADVQVQDALPDWPARHHIALGIAQALAFLHRGCGYRILHRDLKSTNILLDTDFNPKVSDHGLVHLVSGRPGGAGDVVETPGYTAPEVLTSKKYTEKSDVYSYGVVLLELITGKKAVSYVRERAISLTNWVVRLHKERRGREVMDPLVLKTCPLPEYLNRCLDLAVLCVDTDPNGRPTVAEIVSVVEGCCPSPSPLKSPESRLDVPLLR
ncbi:hypothetical protein L7F22_063049 [Adiantum nelumboides]|nr:hypothetical protein [Adiantum nelumboides]